MPVPHVDLDDKALHYLLVGVGLVIGTIIKRGLELLADSFWNTERSQFRKWKRDQNGTSDSK
jgi:hypothetical protein